MAETKPVSDAKPEAPVVYEIKAEKDDPFDDAHRESVKQFAAQNKLDPKLAQSLYQRDVQREMAERKAAVEAFEKNLSAEDAKIKADPTFGGDKFAPLLKEAEVFLESILPGYWKHITERNVHRDYESMRAIHALVQRQRSPGAPALGTPAEVPQEDYPNSPNLKTRG